jgi:predicted nucleic acid-binding protein
VITYIDTSTLLELIIDEDGSERAMTIWASADAVASVSLIVVEARAALAAARRLRRLTKAQHRSAVTELEALVGDLHIVPVTAELVASVAELTEEEGLRGYDAVHLVGALTVEATVLSSADTVLCAAVGCTSPTRLEAEVLVSKPDPPTARETSPCDRDRFAIGKGEVAVRAERLSQLFLCVAHIDRRDQWRQQRIMVAQRHLRPAQQFGLLDEELAQRPLVRLAVDVRSPRCGEDGHVRTKPLEDPSPVTRTRADQHRNLISLEEIGKLPAVAIRHMSIRFLEERSHLVRQRRQRIEDRRSSISTLLRADPQIAQTLRAAVRTR